MKKKAKSVKPFTKDSIMVLPVMKKIDGVRQQVGVVVSRLDKDGTVRFGWSLARVKPRIIDVGANTGIKIRDHADAFNAEYGMKLALQRTNTIGKEMPTTISKAIGDKTTVTKARSATGKTIRQVCVKKGFYIRSIEKFHAVRDAKIK